MADLTAKPRAVTLDAVNAEGSGSTVSSIIFFLLCLIPCFATVIFGGVDIATWSLLAVGWTVLVILWLIENWRAGGVLFNTSSLQLPLVACIVLGLIQLLPVGGTVPGLSLSHSSALSLDPYATRFFVIKLITYLTFFGACLTFIQTERRIRITSWLLVIFPSAMAFYGILQRLASPEGIYGMRETTGAIPFGPFVNQHHFATFMQMSGAVTLALLISGNRSREVRLLLGAAYVLMGVATVSTSSRGGLLGFVAASVFVGLAALVTRRASDGARARVLLFGGAGIAMLLVIFGVVLLIGGNDSLLRGIGVVQADADVTTGRLHFWSIALKIFLQHPIIGAGLEAFGTAFTAHDTWTGQFRVEQAHNEYLQMLADGGLIGLGCLMVFVILLLKKSMSAIASSGEKADIAIGALAGCVGVLVHSFFDFPLRTPSNAFFFLILCTLATTQLSDRSKRRRRSTAP